LDLKNRQRTGKNIGSNRILVKENFYVYLTAEIIMISVFLLYFKHLFI